MGLMSQEQYVESLRDGRVVYWDGDKITDPPSHPNFRVPIEVAKGDYDYDNPEKRDIITYKTETGDLAHRVFQEPRTEEDLQNRIKLASHMSMVGGVTGVYMALLQVKDEVAQINPRYAENIENMYRYARDNDLRGAEVITDAKGDRSRKAHEQDDPDLFLRIVDRNNEGIIVRGAKFHISAGSLVHELVVMPTKGMRQDEADYAVSFSIPANTPGVKMINRSFAPAHLNEFDYPASSHHSCPEALVIFDDVLVPWDRVFLAGESQLATVFARSLGLWERTMGLVAAAESADMLVGAAQLVTEMQGKERNVAAQNTIAEMVCYAQMIRMGLDYACKHYETTPTGMIHPNILAVNAAKYYYASNYHDMMRNIHDLGGGLTLTQPVEADLRHPEAGAYLRKYMHTKDSVDVEERMRIHNLVRDYTADAYGGWHQVTTLQAGGGLLAQRIMMNQLYDMDGAKARAKRAAGIKPKD